VNVWLLRVAGRNAASHNLPCPLPFVRLHNAGIFFDKAPQIASASSAAAMSYCPAIEQRAEDESEGRVGGVVRTVGRVRSSTHKDGLSLSYYYCRWVVSCAVNEPLSLADGWWWCRARLRVSRGVSGFRVASST